MMNTTSLTARSSQAGPSLALMVSVPLAAIGYPFLLKAFHTAVTSSSSSHLVWAAISLFLAVAMPLLGLVLALKLGEHASPSSSEVLAKWIAMLSLASAPIYTATGVLLYMAGDPLSDITVWLAMWLIGFALMARAAFAPAATRAGAAHRPMPSSTRLRVAHGISAAAILLLFLGMHLSNHLAGLQSEAAHRYLMTLFRHVYRARFTEPAIVALFLFMVGSGLALVSGYVKQRADPFRTLQIASGVYLVFFVLGHMNSVFFYARMLLQIPTDWAFATGAPNGMINDAWNIRLLPHYLLGVFFVLTHVVLGARVVAISHGVNDAKANSWTRAGIVLSAIIAVAIILGMVGLRFS